MWLRPARRSSQRLRRPPPRPRAAARRSRRSATQYPVRPAGKVRAHRAAPIAAEVDLTDERRRHEDRRQERDDEARHEEMAPEEIDRDDRRRNVGEDFDGMDLVVESS